MAKKIINVGDRNAVIRLVKKTGASASFSQGVAPQNAVNNTTELSFKLTNKPSSENRFVIGTFDTPNIKNPNLYVTNGSAYTMQGGALLKVTAPVTPTDPNYISRTVGLFLKFTPGELQYVLGDRAGEANPRQFPVRVIDAGSMQPSIEIYTVNNIIATRGLYFDDLNYYIPVYLGTLKHLEESWGAVGGQLGMLVWYSTGSAVSAIDLNVSHQIPVSGITVTNANTNVMVGDTVTITYSVTPTDADIDTVTFTSTDPTKASFASPSNPTLTINAPGSFGVTVKATDILGNSVQSTKNFSADLNISPMVMSVTVNTGEQIALTATPATAGTLAKYDWGDGTTTGYSAVTGAEVVHTFASAGTYQVRFYSSEDLDALTVGRNTAMPGLREVTAWGAVKAKNISFRNSTNLTAVPSTLNAGITNLANMFYGCTSFNQDISGWDVSHVTDFTNMFFGATTFNRPLNGWMTSAALDFTGMFTGAIAFNQDLSGWDVDQVTTFERMFDGAIAFNRPLATWQTSGALNMSGMFRNAGTFNQPIGLWDVDSVTNMSAMFQGTTQATTFNQDISMWNVGNVTNMNTMFKGNIAFNQNLRYWCVSLIESRPVEFTGVGTPIAAVNEPRWGLCPIRDVVVTINGLVEPVRLNDVRQLTYELTPDTPVQSTVWTSSNESIAVIDDSGNVVFTGLGSVTITLVVNGLYTGTKTVTVQDVLQPMTVMTTGVNGGDVMIATNGVMVDWGDGSDPVLITSNNSPVTHSYTDSLKHLIRLTPADADLMPSITIRGEIEEVVNWYPGLNQNISLAGKLQRVPNVAPNTPSFVGLFRNCILFNQDISGWDTSNVTNMTETFKGATLFNQPLNSWDVSNVITMGSMFTGASAFNRPLDLWDVSNVTDMNFMFMDASAFNQDLTWWCVADIKTSPFGFDVRSALVSEHLPMWGTCPNRSYGLIVDNPGDVEVTKTAQLTYNLNPPSTIVTEVWESSNDTIATVTDSGLVTGVSEGTVTMTVTLNKVYTSSVTFDVVPNIELLPPTDLTGQVIESQ